VTGFLFACVVALITGTVVAYPLGLGHLGWKGHFGIGLAGQFVSWFFVTLLGLPSVVRVSFNRVTLFPVWALVGALMVALVIAILMPERKRKGARTRR
jgi:hypothetical protein